jgi:hypothetical protein
MISGQLSAVGFQLSAFCAPVTFSFFPTASGGDEQELKAES